MLSTHYGFLRIAVCGHPSFGRSFSSAFPTAVSQSPLILTRSGAGACDFIHFTFFGIFIACVGVLSACVLVDLKLNIKLHRLAVIVIYLAHIHRECAKPSQTIL